MRLKCLLFFLPLLLPLASETHASQTCSATVSELGIMFGNQAFPLKWEETTMDDGKPPPIQLRTATGCQSDFFVGDVSCSVAVDELDPIRRRRVLQRGVWLPAGEQLAHVDTGAADSA